MSRTECPFSAATVLTVRSGGGSMTHAQRGVSPAAAGVRPCGAYALLRWLEVRFLAPGRESEVVPGLRRASFRHRGVRIEWANCRENVLDFIDWLPKMGYNGFSCNSMFLTPSMPDGTTTKRIGPPEHRDIAECRTKEEKHPCFFCSSAFLPVP